MKFAGRHFGKSEASHEMHEQMDALKASLMELRSDIADLLHQAFGGRTGEHLRETASDTVEQLKARLHELKERGSQGVASVERQIEERPLPAALIAFGVGFAIAMLFSSRR